MTHIMTLYAGRIAGKPHANPFVLDYPRLVAGLAAQQAASRTAAASARISIAPSGNDHAAVDALVFVMERSSGWNAWSVALGGSFHPEVARKPAGHLT